MKSNINQILEKYWNAETSLQEEAELRAYFSSNDVAPDHEQYKDLFSFFSVSRLQSTNLEMEEVLSSLSDMDAILEKYWDAKTSLDEEAQLRDYFAGDMVSSDHEQFKALFSYYQMMRSQESNLDLNQMLDDESRIDDLLEKYWKAEASLEEEKELSVYFAGNKVAAKHKAYAGMFGLFRAKSNESTNIDIEEILLKADKESGHRAIGSSAMPGAAKTKVFVLQKWAVGIAAMFVLGFAAMTVMNPSAESYKYKGQATILDNEAEAQEAYEITKEALAFLSKNMNKGSETIVKSVSKVEKVNIFKDSETKK